MGHDDKHFKDCICYLILTWSTFLSIYTKNRTTVVN